MIIKTNAYLVDIVAGLKDISKGEAKTLIKQGAIRVEGEKITDIEWATKEDEVKVQIGKKHFFNAILKRKHYLEVEKVSLGEETVDEIIEGIRTNPNYWDDYINPFA